MKITELNNGGKQIFISLDQFMKCQCEKHWISFLINYDKNNTIQSATLVCHECEDSWTIDNSLFEFHEKCESCYKDACIARTDVTKSSMHLCPKCNDAINAYLKIQDKDFKYDE